MGFPYSIDCSLVELDCRDEAGYLDRCADRGAGRGLLRGLGADFWDVVGE